MKKWPPGSFPVMTDHRTESNHHQPVLVERVVELLVTVDDGAYLDLTAGGGGHLRALAARLGDQARLYGVDVDPVAVQRATDSLAGTRQFRRVVRAAFGDIAKTVGEFDERAFDGILIDLGISSYQIDEPRRGFSFRYDGPLDMRFDPSRGVPARDLINTLGEDELKGIIRRFGEERQAAGIARAIVREREKGMILTTRQLKELVLTVVKPPHQNKSLARVFQAFRVAVNHELEQIEEVLPAGLALLKPGGRLAVIAYHSLEDRLVKRFIQREAKGVCTCPPGLPACVCGARPSLIPVTPKPVVPDQAEIAANPRARSARLRVVEKLP